MDLQLFKGSNSTTQTYTPTAQEVALQQQALDYSKAVSPNALELNELAFNAIGDNFGTQSVDYGGLVDAANAQTAAAQQGMTNLTNGELPIAYTQNMQDAISSTLENTMGTKLKNLAQNGVLNSSVTETAMNDIEKNAADAVAQNYNTNINTLGNLYGNQINSANSQIATTAAGQEAALQTPKELWNMSLGLNSGGTSSALGAVSGKGTTTQTTSNSSGGLFGGVL